MLGTWYALFATPRLKMKVQFKIEQKAKLILDAVAEPLPIPFNFDSVQVEGSKLVGEGEVFWSPNEKLTVQLEFAEDKLTGTLHLPAIGTFPLEGGKGPGPYLAEHLIAKVQSYRKENVRERTEEEIRIEIDKFLSRMSLEEKVGQLLQCQASHFSFGGEVESDPPEQLIAAGRVGSVLGAFDITKVFELQKIAVEQSPHKIPLLFHNDIIHGSQTIFPIPLAWSCSWDPESVRKACAIAAKEANVSGMVFNHGPMVDLSRDPRWGRVAEGAGEDPYLGSEMAKAQVEGFQGASLFEEGTLIACLKHFIGYGAAEGGRDYNTVDLSEVTLRNVYLPPFEAGLQAGAGAVMNSFNVYQGVPVAANTELLVDLLRDELGFCGVVISDYGSINEIHVHGHAATVKDAAEMAMNAGMDIEMVTRAYDLLPQLVEEGKISEAQIDAAVSRILYLKFKTGLMDDPYRYILPEKEKEYHFHTEHLQASADLARKSTVLLKNDGILPLQKTGKLALIGPFADSKDLLGPWQFSRYGHETTTLYEGLVAKGIAQDQLYFAQGCAVNAAFAGGIEEALAQAEKADVIVLALGESSSMSGEAASRQDISVPMPQRELAEAVISLGKPTVLVLTNGRPLVLDWFQERMDAILETWFLGSRAGEAIADVLLGNYNPSGKLTMSFPAHVGQVPIYYNHLRTGRPLTEQNKGEKFISKYLDGPNDPLYPFGFGLSYTTFVYTGFQLSAAEIAKDQSLTASVVVTNEGALAGTEIVQLYIQDCYGSIVRPVKELKDFARIELEPGESKTVQFVVDAEKLRFWSPKSGYVVEPGEFKVYVGSSSADVQELGFVVI